MTTEIKNLHYRIAQLENKTTILEKKAYWLERENELLTIQKERAESLLTN
tara:strand:+ start:2267 stop:2416 length:150 start_codon:yes stop_codon:yes gene_type:complete